MRPTVVWFSICICLATGVALSLARPILLIPIIALPLVFFAARRLDWIAYVAIVFAYTRADAWLSGATGIPFGTLMVVAIMFSFLATLLYSAKPLLKPGAGFAALVGFFVAAFLISILFTDVTYVAEWTRDAGYALLIFCAVYCFTWDDERLRNVCLLIVVCGAVLSIINILEVVQPSLIHLSHSEGRAAGLLKNANTSAFAVTSSYITLQIYARWSRIHPALMTALQIVLIAGVLVTMSRGGMLLLAGSIIWALFTAPRSSRISTFVAVSAIAAAVAFVVQRLLQSADLTTLYSVQKIMTFVQGHVDDNYRFFLAKFYIGKFLEQPLTGYGFNSTIAPSAANMDLLSFFGVKGPHNTPVTLLTDFGLIPTGLYALFYVFTLGAIVRFRERSTQLLLLLLWGALVIHNIFAHDMHLSRHVMVLFAVIAAFPVAADRIVDSAKANHPTRRISSRI